jgi:tetratricopeptide (TPR) repeat protein
MSQTYLTPQWLEMLSDPYAVLGVPVAADERRIIKRYYSLAKLLHPDRYINDRNENKQLAQVILTHLINPAYEYLIKQSDSRSNNLAMLNQEASYFNLENRKLIDNPYARQMTQMSALEADFFYQQAVNCYSPTQYVSLEQAYQVTKSLSTLNLVYLKIQSSQLGTNVPIDKVFSPDIPTSSQLTPEGLKQENNNSILEVVSKEPVEIKPAQNYAQRHYQRGIIYIKQAKWSEAVIELRDAIKLEPKNSDFHALLGLVHYKQNLLGMARVYTRQALKLNPKQALALKYAAMLGIEENGKILPSSVAKAVSIAGLLGWFRSK